MIIAFSGTDGAGKSTQISQLSRFLEQRGKSPRYLWARGGYTPLILAFKAMALGLLGRKGDTSGFDKEKSASYIERRAGLIQRPIIARLWLTLAILDMAVFYGLYARLLSLRGFVVICDRYVGDTKIDFTRNFPLHFRTDGVAWKLLNAVSPQPSLHFVLTVPVSVSMERSRAKCEPFPDDPGTLAYRLNAYRTFPEFATGRVIALDGTESIDKVAIDIRQAVLSAARCRAST